MSGPVTFSHNPHFLRKSKATAQEATQTYINETYGWVESKPSLGGEVVENMVAMESGEAGPGYAVVSSPSHVEEQQEENECYHNYKSLRHVKH